MRAMYYEQFGERPEVVTLADPTPPPHGVVVRVGATGMCRSDWHGWKGNDPDITLPHVPGHEFAGTVVAAGADVRRVRIGQRVTSPFVCGCGTCPTCRAGDQHVCPDQTQPGFTHWGSFAELVVLHHADVNVVELPDDLDEVAAASLGCRFATSFRAVVDQGRVQEGQWVAVHGCGGVGLSAVMIAAALGAEVVAVDVSDEALALARTFGATRTIDAATVDDVAAAVHDLTGGGAHVSLDALGSLVTMANSIGGLRRRGRHLQVGLLVGDEARPAVPMGRVLGEELELLGVHGLPAHRYGAMLAMVADGRLAPDRLVGRTIGLDAAPEALMAMDDASPTGITVIDRF